MKLLSQRNQISEINNVQSLGRLFQKKYQPDQYCTLLKSFIDNARLTSQLKPRCSKRRSTRRQTFTRSRTRQNIDRNVEMTCLDKHIEVTNRIGVNKQKLNQKRSPRATVGAELPAVLERESKSRISRLVREQKQFVYYSKKGRLLEPNKHSIFAESNIFVMAEGCGKSGDEVSSFVGQFLLKSVKYLFSLEEFRNSKGQNFDIDKIRDYFKQMFESANFELSLSNIDIRRSGCTVCIVYMHEGKVIVASTKQPNVLLVNRSESRFLKHSRPLKSSIAEKIGRFQTSESETKLRPKISKQEDLFEGFGNIYAQNCTCPVQVSLHSYGHSEFVMLGSHSMYQHLTSTQISHTLLSNVDTLLVNKIKEFAETASKRMKTINHQDVTCILIKCGYYK